MAIELLKVTNLGRRHGRIELSVPRDRQFKGYNIYISNGNDVTVEYNLRKTVTVSLNKSTELPSMQRQFFSSPAGIRRVFFISEAEAVTLPNADFWIRVTGIRANDSETTLANSPGKLIEKINASYPV